MLRLFTKPSFFAALSLATTSSISMAQVLEEVIVTAQKRAESLQDVPISVSAMQGDKIQDAGIATMSSLADYVPNLQIADSATNTNIYMRGMGSANNQGFEQSVGMYIDGVYMGRGRQYRSPFVDVDRVEVLRGPQGTLFGKNTVAGAINVTSASPELGEALNGSIAGTAEENGGLITEGYISGSVSDDFALRAAFKYRETDGYMENTFLGSDEPEIESGMIRLTAVWQPSDDLDVNLKYTHSDYDRVGAPSTTKLYLNAEQRNELVPNRSAFASIAYSLMDSAFPTFGQDINEAYTTIKDNNQGFGTNATSGAGNPESSDNATDNLVLKVDWTAGEMLVTSITGYSAYEYIDGVDADWLPLQFIARDDDQEFSQISQEFRITSPGGEFFDYVAGVYYEESDLAFDRQLTIDTNFDGLTPQVFGLDNLNQLLTGGAYSSNQIARNHYYQLDSNSLAVFGQGTFNISDSFRVTVGLRYTEENKDVESVQFLSDQNTGLGVPSTNPYLTAIWANNFNTYNFDYNEDRKTSKWLPSLNLQWDAFDDTLLYLSLSQGFKSGGFTAADDGEPAGVAFSATPNPFDAVHTTPNDEFEFDDEEVNALEIGGKHTLLDGGMTLNWAAFYTEYNNLQTSIFKGIGFGVTNASSTTVQGIEIDLNWQATDNLLVGGSLGWLDAEFDDFKNAACTAIQLDADASCGQPGGLTNNDQSGKETIFAPEYSASVFFDYTRAIGANWDFFVSGETNYKDDFSPAGDADPLDRVDSFTKTNLRFGVRDEHWEVMAFGRNIFDEEAISQSADVPILAGSHFHYADEGAVFGARAKYSY